MFKKFEDHETESVQGIDTRLPDDGLYCVHCETHITDKVHKIDRQGAHRHTCTNPAQLTFNIGCFKAAPGCTQVGIPTSDHSWFNGYRWCIALCAGCQKHLGWHFVGTGDRFHGLILSELMER